MPVSQATIYQPSIPGTALWMGPTLAVAGSYNLVWGTWQIFFPDHLFVMLGMEPINYPWVWQCLGFIVALFGVGYLIAACDPVTHWPFVLTGMAAKVARPIGFLFIYWNGHVPVEMGIVLILNDVIWWVPFGLILRHAYITYIEETARPVENLRDALVSTSTNSGESLLNVSYMQPTLLIFLRHMGCIFSRETMANLAKQRFAIEQIGVRPVIVHMSGDAEASLVTGKFGIETVARVSDVSRSLYRSFGLRRGWFSELFAPFVFQRRMSTHLGRRTKTWGTSGDSMQLGGVFLLHRGRILRWFKHKTIADEVDLLALARAATPIDSDSGIDRMVNEGSPTRPFAEPADVPDFVTEG